MPNPTETGYRHLFPNYQSGDLTLAMVATSNNADTLAQLGWLGESTKV